ncbi:RING-H2 finger protein ATL74-like [Neltuma alba]|uniref:RING-H2 finger protein ATL74-like n=1 Tax=Neltuma alba TaxID=207710 RepID=UPI0010A38CCD|nr:RING-H2 finger protein ATL74-like [Prosopis alba]
MHRRLLDAGLSVSPAYRNKTHESFVRDVNFDANMVIILAALLCALICALGLNSMVRCVLRCSQRFSTETTEQTAARLASTGLKKRHLSRIPVKEYGPGANIPATECPICLGEFEKGDKVRMLPKCNHGFHVRCIDTWLLSHSSCPNCRHSLLEKSTNPSLNSNGRSEVGEPAGAQAPADGPGNMQVHALVVDEQAS